jgi:hypothetical protein
VELWSFFQRREAVRGSMMTQYDRLEALVYVALQASQLALGQRPPDQPIAIDSNKGCNDVVASRTHGTIPAGSPATAENAPKLGSSTY